MFFRFFGIYENKERLKIKRNPNSKLFLIIKENIQVNLINQLIKLHVYLQKYLVINNNNNNERKLFI